MAGNMAVTGAGGGYTGGTVQDVSRREVGPRAPADAGLPAGGGQTEDAFDSGPRLDRSRMARLASPTSVQAAGLSGATSPQVAGDWTAGTRDASEQLLRQTQMGDARTGASSVSPADRKRLLDARFGELLRALGYAAT